MSTTYAILLDADWNTIRDGMITVRYPKILFEETEESLKLKEGDRVVVVESEELIGLLGKIHRFKTGLTGQPYIEVELD